MSRAVILPVKNGSSKSTTVDYSISKIIDNDHNSKVENVDVNSKILTEVSYPMSKIIDQAINSTVSQVLPFRVKFTTVGLDGFTVPPIGIAIIGFNNYIL